MSAAASAARHTSEPIRPLAPSTPTLIIAGLLARDSYPHSGPGTATPQRHAGNPAAAGSAGRGGEGVRIIERADHGEGLRPPDHVGSNRTHPVGRPGLLGPEVLARRLR